MSTGASLNRFASVQEVGTPREFLQPVEARFGRLLFDLAATRENSVAGPDSCFTPEQDSLKQEWPRCLCWLNPPFASIYPWAKKCAEQGSAGTRALFLVPASIGSTWYRDWVQGHSLVIPLVGRIKFVGHKQGFPKDLMLCAYGMGISGVAEQWEWRR